MTTDISRADALTDLLPCPLCGGAAEIYNPFHMLGRPGEPATYNGGVRCRECGCSTKATTPPDAAIAAWNRCAPIEQPAAAPNGYCERAGGCVCGGDLPRVREGCSEWVKCEAAHALANDLRFEQMSAIEKLGGAIESALDETPVSDVLSVLTGAFVGLAVELVRRHGHDVAREIKVDGGQQRDITIHAPKELGDVDALKT